MILHLFSYGSKHWFLFVWIIITPLSSTCCRAIGLDRRLLTGNDASLLRQIARDLLHSLSRSHDNTWHNLVRKNRSAALVGQVDNMLVEFPLSERNRWCQARTRTDKDTNCYAISQHLSEHWVDVTHVTGNCIWLLLEYFFSTFIVQLRLRYNWHRVG